MKNKHSQEYQALLDEIEESGKPKLPKTQRSTKTTVMLSQESLDVLAAMKERWGWKIKDSIDHAIDKHLFVDFIKILEPSKPEVFEYAGRKSIVLSTESLIKLNRESGKSKVPRDKIINAALWAMAARLDRYLEERNVNLEHIRNDLEKLLSEIDRVSDKIVEVLGDDDPVHARMADVHDFTKTLILDIQDEIEDDVTVEYPVEIIRG